jgi:diguanylate cyclase (GGDEF)-like protein
MLGGTGRWLLFAFALFVGFLPASVAAQSVRVEQFCHADASTTENWEQVSLQPARWHCANDGWSLSPDVVMIRFDLGSEDGRALPQSLVTHTGNFQQIDIGVVGADGHVAWSTAGPNDPHHLSNGPYLVLPVSGVTSETRSIAVRVVRPWSKTTLSEMRLDPAAEGTGWPLPRIVAMAAICGMLLVPLLINTAFYSVLPERYVIWHLVMVAGMLVQAAFATGFVHLFFESSALWEWQASNLAFAAMAGAALLFAATFIEARALSPRLRRVARVLGPAMWVVGVVASIPLDFVRPWSAPMMHVSIGAVIVVLAWMLWNAHQRGSRSVRLQIIAWLPIFAIGSWRIATYLLPGLHPTEAIEVYQLALALEVLVTAFGIVSRFVEVRQERDRATARALELEGVADRDPLTGLRNRRTIEERFDRLFATGFRTMAVLDLDHFKTVNDTHGHATGDLVLRAAARALIDDRDTRAIRMGGEEFLLLLRGADAAARAERCRRAITARIAAEVSGLDRIVTASMGLVEHDTRGVLRIEFATLYARCDQLLYEAKRLGRNRTMREKVTGFGATNRAVA